MARAWWSSLSFQTCREGNGMVPPAEGMARPSCSQVAKRGDDERGRYGVGENQNPLGIAPRVHGPSATATSMAAVQRGRVVRASLPQQAGSDGRQ